MAIRGDAASITKKWQTNTAAAVPNVVAGVDRVTENPMQKAAAQADVWAANTAAAKEKFRRNTAATTTEDWKAATKQGAQRIAQGVQAKGQKMEQHMTRFIPHLQRGQEILKGMPRGNLEQNLARMLANARHNAEFKRT